MEICGKKMKTATIDSRLCRSCQNGASPNRYHAAGLPDRIGALCVRTSMVRMEKQGRLTNTFKEPFRKREPWKVVPSPRVFDEAPDVD